MAAPIPPEYVSQLTPEQIAALRAGVQVPAETPPPPEPTFGQSMVGGLSRGMAPAAGHYDVAKLDTTAPPKVETIKVADSVPRPSTPFDSLAEGPAAAGVDSAAATAIMAIPDTSTSSSTTVQRGLKLDQATIDAQRASYDAEAKSARDRGSELADVQDKAAESAADDAKFLGTPEQYAKQRQDLEQRAQLIEKEKAKAWQEAQKRADEALSSRVDPNHYFKSQGALGKLFTSLSLVIGGVLAGFDNKDKAGNRVAQQLDEFVKRDIQAQIVNLENKNRGADRARNAYRDLLAASQDVNQAAQMLYSRQMDAINARAKAMALKAKGPETRYKAEQIATAAERAKAESDIRVQELVQDKVVKTYQTTSNAGMKIKALLDIAKESRGQALKPLQSEDRNKFDSDLNTMEMTRDLAGMRGKFSKAQGIKFLRELDTNAYLFETFAPILAIAWGKALTAEQRSSMDENVLYAKLGQALLSENGQAALKKIYDIAEARLATNLEALAPYNNIEPYVRRASKAAQRARASWANADMSQ